MVRSRLQSLETEVGDLTELFSTIRSDLLASASDAEIRLSALQDTIATLETRITALEAENHKLKSAVGEITATRAKQTRPSSSSPPPSLRPNCTSSSARTHTSASPTTLPSPPRQHTVHRPRTSPLLVLLPPTPTVPEMVWASWGTTTTTTKPPVPPPLSDLGYWWFTLAPVSF